MFDDRGLVIQGTVACRVTEGVVAGNRELAANVPTFWSELGVTGWNTLR